MEFLLKLARRVDGELVGEAEVEELLRALAARRAQSLEHGRVGR